MGKTLINAITGLMAKDRLDFYGFGFPASVHHDRRDIKEETPLSDTHREIYRKTDARRTKGQLMIDRFHTF